MKKLVGGLSVCILAFTSFVPVAYTETIQEKCDRLEREGEKLPPECMKIPVPENPNPAPQPSVRPTPAPEEEPPHEAWESPNSGGSDSGSSKPDKPEKPAKPEKPVKEPSTSGSDGGSKKPSGSSSTGDKKPTGSSSNSGGVSSNGSGRPDTVCAGEFCNPEDTLIGGVGSINDRYPNRNPGQGAATGSETSGPTVRYPDVVKPADRNTLQENIGTVIETGDGLAIRRGEEIVLISPDHAEDLKVGERVELSRGSKGSQIQKDSGDAKGSERNRIMAFCASITEPGRAARCYRIYDEDIEGVSWRESEKYFPDSEGYTGADDKRDAARHCIFLGGMTTRGDEAIARRVADIHEEESPSAPGDPAYSAASEAMDRHNNEVGIQIGHESNGDFQLVINKCVTAARAAEKVPMEDVANSSSPGLIYFMGP